MVSKGIFFLQRNLIDELSLLEIPPSIIPIKRGGDGVGKALSDPGQGIHLPPNPMQMSHYDEHNNYLPSPICIYPPKLSKIIHVATGLTRDVFFAEAVVESQLTVIAAQGVINQMIDEYNLDYHENYLHPIYHTFALVSKIEGETQIPNFVYPFIVPKDIWVRGFGCDDKGKGRKLNNFMGRLGDHATTVPPEPYYRVSEMFA